MFKMSFFGIIQKLDWGFENEKYHHSTREDLIFRGELNDLANADDWLTYNTKIFDKFHEVRNDKTNKLHILKFNIERLEDLAFSLSFCVPNRLMHDGRYRFEIDTLARRTISLDRDIAYEIIELQRQIITILTKSEKIKLVDTKPKRLINYNTAYSYDFEQKQAKKRTWLFWRK